MDAVCVHADLGCQVHALAAALHAINLYCATICAALICCCAPLHKHNRHSRQWRGQDIRGFASLILAVAWSCEAAAALLRPSDIVHLVAALMGPLSWLAAAVFHVALWTRRSAAPILYLAIYWGLEFVSTATVIWQHGVAGISTDHIQIYIQGVSLLMTLVICVVDCVCFYDEVTKRFRNSPKSGNSENICYKHNETHFYSKFSFFWLNSLLYKGYKSPLDPDYLGDLPEDERSMKYYTKFMKIYHDQSESKTKQRSPSLLACYFRNVWPNFYLAGILKLFGDLIAVIPPLGLAIIIQYIQGPAKNYDHNYKVTIEEFFGNGYVMLLVVTLALISQAFLSQNSTHMVTVEGTRLKTALQSMVYDKCMRLAPWSPTDAVEDEESPLLRDPEETTVTRSGLITNLVSQDTYNIMSCVWICHYIWAIPLKVAVILYLLYTKLGISAIIGCVVSVLLITPMQFYIGKKISDNSKGISKCTDHRISKMTEILQGMDVIKLYVWEDLFKEKILQLREVELKLLNKDSIYWSFLTFTTQISTILITVITFSVHYLVDANNHLTTVKVFAGLAFFNQLTVPLLILPVTVLMVIQAMVSTKRIGEFLELPESNNIREDSYDDQGKPLKDDQWRDSVAESRDSNEYEDKDTKEEADDHESGDQFSDDEIFISSHRNEGVVKMKNATFTWGKGADDMLLEVDDLEISAGKLIMVVGTTGSGKSSLLSAILGEMYLYKGDVIQNKNCSMWYAGQPPWLLEGTVRDNIVMNSSWCQRKYGRVLRATGLRPDLQLLPEGDATRLGSHGAPLSGGQRIRVCVARALYSGARLLALDEPLGALDAALARHLVARALVPAARSGRTVIVATNRLELLHYADMVIAMEDGRVSGVGRIGSNGVDSPVARWARLASEARAAASRAGVGPPGGTARERSRLLRALSRTRFHSANSDDTLIGITEAAGSHLLSEVPTCAGGSWRRRPSQRPRPALGRQLSSPPPSMYNYKCRPTVRRAVSVDESNTTLQREASMLRRWLKPRTTRTLTRWTPRTLRRLISTDSEAASEDNQTNDVTDEPMLEATQYSSLTLNGINSNADTGEDIADSISKTDEILNECAIWDEYRRACGWWGTAYWVAAAAAQALALAADYWLTYTTADGTTVPDEQQSWGVVRVYAAWCGGGALLSGAAQAACACAGAAARRAIHDKLLHATLRASPQHHRVTPLGNALHRFSSDILVIDKKLPTAITRWAQLALLCIAAILVNAAMAPWSLLASVPAVFFYFSLQSIYLTNATELQSAEARSAASVVSLCAEACAGASTIRAGRLQTRMRTAFMRRLDANHNTLLLLNSANRWLGLTLDLVGAGIVFVSLTVSVCGGAGGAGAAGLAGAYSLLLPAYLAHLAKCRADLHLQLAALERVRRDTNVPQEDYRDDCPIPKNWQRNGKIELENVSVLPEPGAVAILNNINLTIQPSEKVAICGRSGSGKSTLLLTCVGATTISQGRVLVDGEDITRVPLRALRHRVVVVPQEPAMFSGTLRENLDPLAVHTDEEIWQCLRAVGLFEFVTAQTAGLECIVSGRNGRGGWSAGRVGRLGAARAALHARLASALLLDEPAAALDAPAERALLHAMAAVAPHTTILTVAHRVSSVRGYDRAVVLEAGSAVEQGAVSTLLAQPSSRLARMLANANRLT